MKHIVITGVSRGLGRALVDAFVAGGHRVSGCARSREAVGALGERFASPHRFDVLDTSDDAAVQRWSDAVLDSGGAPDLLINNAAMINANAPLWQVPYDEFDRLLAVNVRGVYSVCRHFLPAMLARGSGVIVNLSSGWGRSVSPEVAPYCASKYAIEGLTLALAAELPQGLAAVPVSPGVVNTDMLQSCFGDGAASAPSPQDWARRAAPWLLALDASDNGRSLTTP